MTECNDCGADVVHVWRHRAFEGETHREVRWVCADCHPKLPNTLATAESSTSDRTTDESETVAMTDGGHSACPDCGGVTVNGQGLFSCLDCTWTGPC